MRAAGQLVDDLAMSTMDAIEDADGQPDVFLCNERRMVYGYFFKGVIMSHRM